MSYPLTSARSTLLEQASWIQQHKHILHNGIASCCATLLLAEHWDVPVAPADSLGSYQFATSHASGFLVQLGSVTAFITAGHVINAARERGERGRRVSALRLLPLNTVAAAPKLEWKAAELGDDFLMPIEHRGVDVGALRLPPRIARLSHRAGLHATTLDMLSDDRGYDAHYLVGSPAEVVQHSVELPSVDTALLRSSGATTWWPVEMLDFVPEGFDHPHTRRFVKVPVGEVVRPSSDPKNISNIQGLSGGPLFGVSWDVGEKGLRILSSIVGLQSEWNATSRLSAVVRGDFVGVVAEVALQRWNRTPPRIKTYKTRKA